VTLIKVLVLVVFASFGIYHTLKRSDWISAFTTPSFAPNGVTGILAAMGLTFIAFEGYEIIVQSGEEVKNPERNIPKAILISLWVVVAIYISVAFALIGAVQTEEPSWMYIGKLAEFSLIRVANQIMPLGSIVIIAGGLVSTISAMNATIYSSSRVVFALSRFGYLPEKLSQINEKTKTPHYAIFFSYLIILLMSFTPIEFVASAADVMFLFLFILVNFVLVVLRLRRPDLNRSFKVPFAPYVPFAAIITQLVIGYYLVSEVEHGAYVVALAFLWLLFGTVTYFAYSEKEKDKRVKREIRTVYEELPLEEGYRILVPVANPTVATKLGKLAEIIAKSKKGQIIFLHVLTLPDQTPLYAADEYVEQAKGFVKEVIDSVSVPAGGIVKVGRKISEAVINAVDELKPDLVILGWRGRTFRKDFILGSTIDPILLKAKSDVAVVKFGVGFGKFERVLLPTAGGPHAKLAAELAKAIGSEVTLMFVGKSEEDRKRAEKVFEEAEKILGDKVVKKVFRVSKDVVGEISKEAEKHDVVLMGSTAEPFLKNFLMGVFPEKVVKRTTKTVIMTRKFVRIIEAVKK